MQLLIPNFSLITGQNESPAVVRFQCDTFSVLNYINMHLGFVGAKVAPQNSHQDLVINGAHDV